MSHISNKVKFLIIGYVLILISIPLSMVLVSRTQIFSSKADNKTSPAIEQKTITQAKEIPDQPPNKSQSILDQLREITNEASKDARLETDISENQQLVVFGPTLNFKINYQARPQNKNEGKIFLGIAAGQMQNRPSYLLSFTLDLPSSGEKTNFSIAGLAAGSTYTAYIKSDQTVATASSFVASSTQTVLNNNQPLILLAGDLNEDNVINTADYSIALLAYGSTSTSSNWNNRADFNRDGVVNNLDIAWIIKNFGITGMSGSWVSGPPLASGSATVQPLLAQEASKSGGYWLWIPEVD